MDHLPSNAEALHQRFDETTSPLDEFDDCMPSTRAASLTSLLIKMLGVLILVLSASMIAWSMYERVATGQPFDAGFGLTVAGMAIVALLCGGMLWGVGALLNFAEQLVRRMDRLEHAGGDSVGRLSADASAGFALSPQPGKDESFGNDVTQPRSPADGDGQTLARIVSLLEELRDLTVLPQQTRREIRDRLEMLRVRRLCQGVTDAIEQKRVRLARDRLAEAVTLLGPSPSLERLRTRIDDLAIRIEPLAYTSVYNAVQQATANGQWDRAIETAAAIAREYPESQRCRRLYDHTRMLKDYAAIQQFTSHHRWTEAVAAADQFLDAYPDSAEAETLAVEIRTLRENAEILKRKQQEKQIRDFIRQRRYADALRIARHVVATYPNSPQAAALRSTMPTLMEQAQQAATPATETPTVSHA